MVAHRLALLNGPNLHMLGTREPEIYGHVSLADIEGDVSTYCLEIGTSCVASQHNAENDMIEKLWSLRDTVSGIIINPGAFTHYSWAIGDALSGVGLPTVEVHLSNPDAREPWRRTSVVSPHCIGTVSGFGSRGYRFAVDALVDHLADV